MYAKNNETVSGVSKIAQIIEMRTVERHILIKNSNNKNNSENVP